MKWEGRKVREFQAEEAPVRPEAPWKERSQCEERRGDEAADLGWVQSGL